MKKTDEIHSDFLSEIFKIYETEKEQLSFNEDNNSFCQISQIKNYNSDYSTIYLGDSERIAKNCLLKKGIYIKENCIIKVKKITLVLINFIYYFFLEDFIQVNKVLKSGPNKKIIPIPTTEQIFLNKVKFKENIYLERFKEDLIYEGQYIIKNCLKSNNIITLLKHSNILYLDNKEFYGRLIEKKNDLLIIVDKDEYICYINTYKEHRNINCNKYYLFKNLKFIQLSEDSNIKYYEITNKTKIQKVNNKIYMKIRKKMENFALIKFIFIDFNDKHNIFTEINIGHKFININKKIKYICLMEENIESSYYIQDFILISQGKLDKKYCFNSFVYKNELNRMHCFINNINRNNYCYEIIYLSKIEKYLPNEFNIDNKYKLIEYDNFDSKNRRKFNIINSPIIPKLYNKNTKNNSLEIIYLINENN